MSKCSARCYSCQMCVLMNSCWAVAARAAGRGDGSAFPASSAVARVSISSRCWHNGRARRAATTAIAAKQLQHLYRWLLHYSSISGFVGLTATNPVPAVLLLLLLSGDCW